MLSDYEIHVINAWRDIADSWVYRGKAIHASLDQLAENGSIRGMEDMPAFSFNAGQHNPNFGGGGQQLPAGKHPVVISKSALAPTLKGDGGKMVLTMTAIDGPAKGGAQTENLNLQNKSPEAVRIANEQLSAICAVIGKPGLVMQNTEELHDIPFVIEVAPQSNNPQYTEIVAVFTMDGRTPADVVAGGGQQQQQQNNFGGGQQQGNGFAGQQNNNGGGFGGGDQAQQQQNGAFGGGQQQGNGFGGGAAAGAGTGGGQPAWGGGGGGAAGGGQQQGGWGAR